MDLAMQTVLQLPNRNDAESAGGRLAQILHESSYLLEASRDSEDPEVRSAAIDLAIRSLRAASLALEPVRRTPAPVKPGRIVRGPWAQSRRS